MKTGALILGFVSILGCLHGRSWRPQFGCLLGIAFALGAIQTWRDRVFELPNRYGKPSVWNGWQARGWAVIMGLCSVASWNAVLMAWAVDKVSTHWIGVELALCSSAAALFFGLIGLGAIPQLTASGMQRVLTLAVMAWGLGIMVLAAIAGVLIGSYMFVTGHTLR